MQDDTENPKPVQWDHLKEWDGEGFKRERTCVYLRPVHIDVWQKPSQYCKAIGLQLKIKFKNSTLKDYHQKKKKKQGLGRTSCQYGELDRGLITEPRQGTPPW